MFIEAIAIPRSRDSLDLLSTMTKTDTSEANKSGNAYPTYSKGLAHVKSRELLKRYLKYIVACG
jgi:hypothetical protein